MPNSRSECTVKTGKSVLKNIDSAHILTITTTIGEQTVNKVNKHGYGIMACIRGESS